MTLLLDLRITRGLLLLSSLFALTNFRPVEAQPDDAVAHYRAGYTQLQGKDFRNAAIELESAVGLDSTYGDAHYALGMARASLGEYDKSALSLEAALRHGVSKTDLADRIPGLLGDLFYKAALRSRQQRRFGEAIQHAEASLRYKPGNAQAFYTIGLCHISLRQPDKAAVAFVAASAADPNYAWPYKSLGDIHRQRGELRQAAAMYRKAIAVDGKLVQAYSGLAQVQIASEDLEGAVTTLRTAVSLDATYGEGFVLIGTALIQLRRHGEAIAPLLKAVEIDAKDAQTRYRLAEAYLGIGNYQATVEAGNAAVTRQKDFYAAQVILADAHAELGQLAEARSWYGRAIADSRFKDYCAHKLEELDAAQTRAQGQQ
ncbi:MAG: tetratricopeptide repeat protein [bacterium]|nr:tetratricopeptide repeat protein [bacterium]